MIIGLPLLLVLLILGIVLTVVGLRGRRVDDHPHCRKCGFDLIGLPKDVSRCSECGTDLANPAAIRTGQRNRRPALLAGGLAILLIVAVALSLTGVVILRGIDVEQRKSTWVLVIETRGSGNASAWNELARRARAGSLSASTASTLVERALARQADLNITWQPSWGDFIETARDMQLATDAQWKRYARQSSHFALEIRHQIRAGDDIPARLSNQHRVGNRNRLVLRITEKHHSGELTSSLRHNDNRSTSYMFGSNAVIFDNYTVLLDHDACLAAMPGERGIRVSFDAAILESFESTTPLTEWTNHLDGRWTLVPADTQTVEIIDDESLRHGVEEAVGIEYVSVTRSGAEKHLSVTLNCNHPPVPLAFEAAARDPATGREWKLSSFTVRAGGNAGVMSAGEVEGFNVSTFDLVLRSSERVARNSTTITRMWNGELVFKGLVEGRPMTRITAATPASAPRSPQSPSPGTPPAPR